MDPESMLTCPYNLSHRIRRSVFQMHLTKCRKNYPNTTKLKCAFDPTHIIESAEYSHHLNVCPSSGSTLSGVYSMEPTRQLGAVSLEEACSTGVTLSQETWVTDHPKYDPWKATQSKNVLRVQIGLSKAQRKAKKTEERLRHAALENNEASCSTSQSEVPKEQDYEKPLRVPKKPPAALSGVPSRNTSIDVPSRNTSIDVPSRNTSFEVPSRNTSVEVESLISQFQKINSNEKAPEEKKKTPPVSQKTDSEDENNTSRCSKGSGKAKPSNNVVEDKSFVSVCSANSTQTKSNILSLIGQNIKGSGSPANRSMNNSFRKDNNPVANKENNTPGMSTSKNPSTHNDGDNYSVKSDETEETDKRSLDLESSLRQNPRCAAKFFFALKGAKKISTGRGITVAYDNFRSEKVTKSDECSLDGYGEGGELELDFDDVDLQQ